MVELGAQAVLPDADFGSRLSGNQQATYPLHYYSHMLLRWPTEWAYFNLIYEFCSSILEELLSSYK